VARPEPSDAPTYRSLTSRAEFTHYRDHEVSAPAVAKIDQAVDKLS